MARPALVHANFSNLHGAPVRRMGRPPRTLSRAWPLVPPRRPSGTQPRNTPQQHLTVRQTNETDVNLPDTCNRCPESGGRPSQPVVSSTHGNHTTSSYNPPGEGHASRTPRPTCSRERGGATPGPVLPPHPLLPRARSTRGRAKGPGQIRGTSGRADNHKNVNVPPATVYYRRERASGDKCTAGTSAHPLQGVERLGRARLRHV